MNLYSSVAGGGALTSQTSFLLKSGAALFNVLTVLGELQRSFAHWQRAQRLPT